VTVARVRIGQNSVKDLSQLTAGWVDGDSQQEVACRMMYRRPVTYTRQLACNQCNCNV